MPVKFLNTRSGALAILKSCEVAGCAGEACFGQEVNFKMAMDKLEQKQIEPARVAVGRWYCAAHRPDRIAS